MTARILIIDDEPDAEDLFRQNFRRELRRGQFQLVFANSGEQALKLLFDQSEPIANIVFSDVKMPGMSGLEVLKNIHDRCPQIPVYMITAFASQDVEDDARNLGASGFFTKPINFEALGTVLSDAVGTGSP